MPTSFRHEALFYAGQDEFLDWTLPFLREGIAAGDPTLVVVAVPKIAALRGALGADADQVHFADMAQVGANPARIIAAWREFVAQHGGDGRRLRGIGEPIGPDRDDHELTECHRHEALLNLAFADTSDFWLVCPYDTDALDPVTLETAWRTHPGVHADGVAVPSADYHGLDQIAEPVSDPLPEPPRGTESLAFTLDTLTEVRRRLYAHATREGLNDRRLADLVLAVNEIATNSVRHGGGSGCLRIWRDGGRIVCDIRDRGRIVAPLAGRERPAAQQTGGYGLWLANQLCDLVQVRAFADGGVVRLNMRL